MLEKQINQKVKGSKVTKNAPGIFTGYSLGKITSIIQSANIRETLETISIPVFDEYTIEPVSKVKYLLQQSNKYKDLVTLYKPLVYYSQISELIQSGDFIIEDFTLKAPDLQKFIISISLKVNGLKIQDIVKIDSFELFHTVGIDSDDISDTRVEWIKVNQKHKYSYTKFIEDHISFEDMKNTLIRLDEIKFPESKTIAA